MPRRKPGVRACLASVISSRLAIVNSKRALIVSALVLLFALPRLFANGGAWQTGVPVTGNAAATDEKKTTNVTIEDEKLTIDLHQEFAVVEVRYRMKNTGGQVDQDFFFPGRERTVSVANNIGAMRLKARVEIDGHVRETPALEVRRFAGNGFRAAITEQFELPYLFGRSAYVVFSNVTEAIMSPPPCHGGIASSSSALPYNTPMPVGPKILCPEKV